MDVSALKAFYNGKRVLVTGHTGFKGAWLCRVLSAFGAEVFGYALPPATEPCIFQLLHGESRMRSAYGDVRDFDRLCAFVSETAPELVFHLAAQPIVRASYQFPRETYETNVMGTVNLLECIRRSDSVRGVLNVTTDKVYANGTGVSEAFTETAKLDGRDPYANSKSCSELVTHSYKQSFFSDSHPVSISTARAGNVIGGGDFAADRIIPDCVRAAVRGESIQIRNPCSTRPYQHVLDAVHAYLLIMQKQTENHRFEGAYNVGPDEGGTSTGALADLFATFWGGGVRWHSTNEKNAPFEAAALSLDCTKLKSALGWQPVLTLPEAVEYTVAWYQVWNAGRDCTAETEQQIRSFFQL